MSFSIHIIWISLQTMAYVNHIGINKPYIRVYTHVSVNHV